MRLRRGWLALLVCAGGAAVSATGCANLGNLSKGEDGGEDASAADTSAPPEASALDSTSPKDGAALDSTLADSRAADDSDTASDTGHDKDSAATDSSAVSPSDATLDTASETTPDATGTSDTGTTGGGGDGSGDAIVDAGFPDGSVTIGGVLSGLTSGSTIVLADNAGGTVTLSSNGPFSFPTPYAHGAAYAVTVQTVPLPNTEICVVSSGSGVTGASSITSVLVSCDTAVAITTGQDHTCALVTGGEVDCWGDNSLDQLASGTLAYSTTPVPIPGLFGVTAIDAGYDHTCALLGSGAVYCWGYGDLGQLGGGAVVNTSGPQQVPGLNASAISAGGNHSCAIPVTGGVVCWGDNTSGDLGNGSTTLSAAPVAVTGKPDAGAGSGLMGTTMAIAAGGDHTCALSSTGVVQCWGSNSFGQLGNATMTSSPSPVTVTGVSTATTIAAGSNHSCARLASGGIDCWGDNQNSELGVGTSNLGSSTPLLVALGFGPASSVSCGAIHTCAVLMNGDVACWGGNSSGQIGNGAINQAATTPALTHGINGASWVAAGTGSSCAVVGGGVQCWGSDSIGQLGDGAQLAFPVPTPVNLGGTVALAAAAQQSTCAKLQDGGVECWALNTFGQLGNGGVVTQTAPVTAVGLGGGIKALAAGGDHACALLADGTVDCWGEGNTGQLGNGTTASEYTPTAVPGLTGIGSLAVGQNHTCTLSTGGTLDCFGWNLSGQCGNGTQVDLYTVGPVPSLSTVSVSAVATGAQHTCALLTAGGVDCWGANVSGEIGLGSTSAAVDVPTQVPGLSTATGLALGAEHTCARTSGGSVDCWGSNTYQQLGQSGTQQTSPTPVPGVSGVTAIAAGWYHTCVIEGAASAVECWGYDAFGQIGNGTISTQLPPTPVSGLTGVVSLAIGEYHSCAVLSDGGIDCWGWNGNGEITGAPIDQLEPVPVR